MPSATEPAAPEVLAPPTQDLPRALGLAAGLLAGMYLAVRPAPNQFMLFTSEAGFAGLLAVLLALLAAARAMLSRPAVFIPERLMLAAILFHAALPYITFRAGLFLLSSRLKARSRGVPPCPWRARRPIAGV